MVTNNISESIALWKLLIFMDSKGWYNKRIRVLGDSELIIKQIKNIYRVSNNDIRVIQREIKEFLKRFKDLSIIHVPREYNELANERA